MNIRSVNVLGAFFKAIGQLGDPAARRVVWISLGISLGVFVGLWTAIGYLLANTALFELGWLETLADVLGGLTTLVFTWFLFPAVVSAVIAVLLDDVARAVEARHYPHLPDAPGAGAAATVFTAAKFLGAAAAAACGWRIIALPAGGATMAGPIGTCCGDSNSMGCSIESTSIGCCG